MTDQENGHLSFEAARDTEADKPKTLLGKLLDAKRSVGYIQKRGFHPTKKFKFVQGLDVRKAIRDELLDRNIDFQTRCIDSHQRDVTTTTNDGRTRVVTHTEVTMEYKFVDIDNPSDELIFSWRGWGDGDAGYNAFGAYTGAYRYFLDNYFMLLTGDIAPEVWNKEMEAGRATVRAEEEKYAREQLSKKKGVKIVGGPPHIPTVDELADSDDSKNPTPEPLDESWRGVHLKMCKGLDDFYKGGTVGDIKLKHLIDANRVFVSNVNNHLDGYTAPAHHQLANALVSRLMWEIDQGNIEETVIDGKYHHEIVQKK